MVLVFFPCGNISCGVTWNDNVTIFVFGQCRIPSVKGPFVTFCIIDCRYGQFQIWYKISEACRASQRSFGGIFFLDRERYIHQLFFIRCAIVVLILFILCRIRRIAFRYCSFSVLGKSIVPTYEYDIIALRIDRFRCLEA